MNTNSLNLRNAKSIFAIVTAFVLFVSVPFVSSANGGKNDKKAHTVTEQQVTVQYIGVSEENIVFHVEFENPTSEKFWLIIRNDAGDVVYRKQFNDAHFSKTVYFQKAEASDIHPTFIIRNGDSEVVRQFAINTTLTENTVVTRL